MKPGKLSPELLGSLLAKFGRADPRVLVGPRVGEDAAAIDFGDRLLVAKTDPVTFATDLIGWYAVNVNANDIACMGAEPRWFLGALLLPETAQESDVTAIFDQLNAACRALDITPVGGHTEVTLGLDRPILIGCLLGEVARDGLISSAGAHPGDVLFLSAPIAIEGTALLAREVGEELVRKGVSQTAVTRARQFLFDPGISVVPAARRAREIGGVTAFHDPTEGGLATGLAELALASETGLEVDTVPVWPETQEICDALGLDPLGLIASGSLLMAVRPDRAEGMPFLRIGHLLPAGEGNWLISPDGTRRPLPVFERDELARYFSRG